MNINISLYRARVGGFTSTAHRLSLKTYYAKDMGNALAFLLLFCYGKRYLTLSLFFHFSRYLIIAPCTYTTEDFTYSRQAPCTASELQFLSSAIIIITLVSLILLSGDVHPNPGPPLNDNSISIVHNNICSLKTKLSLVEAELNSYDIITISEWDLATQWHH